MTGQSQVLVDEPLRGGMQRNEAHLISLAVDTEMHAALAALNIVNAEPGRLR